MKKVLLVLVILSSFFVGCLEETASEKIEVTTNDVQRSVKKGVNRLKEVACSEGDAKCLEEKVIHRAQESADLIKDKTKEVIDKVN